MNRTDCNLVITRRIDDLSEALDRIEGNLPAMPARAVGLTRATVRRVTATTGAIANDVGRQVGRLSDTAGEALSTTFGQARSAVERTSTMAANTTKETTGQARAQGARTAKAAERATTALLDDATRAIDPDGDGRPASLDDWSKADLYERAQELDVDGRSSMSKRDLVRAIRAA